MDKILGPIKLVFKKLWAWILKHKPVSISAAAAVTVLLVGSVTASACLNSPKIVPLLAAKDLVGDATSREDTEDVLDLWKKGSVELSATKYGPGTLNYLKNSSVTGKVYFSDGEVFLERLNAKINRLEIDASVYFSDDTVYLSEKYILEAAYGGSPEDLADDFKNSIFAYGSGSNFAIKNEERYESILNILENLGDDEFGKDGKKLAKKLLTDIYAIIRKEADFDSQRGKVEVLGDSFRARTVTVTADPESRAEITRKVIDYLAEEEEAVLDFLTKHDRRALAFAKKYLDVEDGTSAAELYKSKIDELSKNRDEICQKIIEKNDTLTVKLITAPRSSTLIKLQITDGDATLFNLETERGGIKKADRISISIGDVAMSYDVTENKKGNYAASLKVNGEERFAIAINEKDGKFSLILDGESSGVSLSGTVTSEGKTTVLVTDKMDMISYDGERKAEEYTTDLTLKITQRDKMPDVEKVECTPISDIKENDVKKWRNQLLKIVF